MKMRNNILIILAVVLSVLSVGCGKIEYKQINGVIWNTTYHITYKSDKDFSDSVINALRVVERSVSAFDPKSIVSQVNRNEAVELDSIFRKVYLKSVELNKLSFGYFDPTVSPLINAMGFGYEEAENVEKLDRLFDFVGISKSRIEGNRLVKDDSRLTFNFSAIAKGFGSDEVAEMFRRNGVNDFIVEIGGEVVAHGKSPRGGAWNVAIESPSADLKREAKLIVELEDYYYCCTHLSLHEEDRVKSISIIVNELSQLDKPAIIAGDFNALPNSMPMQFLARQFHVFPKSGASFTFPANNPKREIDYIALYSGGGATANVLYHEVLSAPVESDHAPIVARVEIPK